VRFVRCKGVGLLELMLSLAVIGVLMVMVVRWYTKFQSDRKINDTVAMLQAAQGASLRWLALPRSGARAKGVAVDTLVDVGLLDRHWRISPWGKAWQLHVDAAQRRHVQVWMPGIPPGICRYMSDLLGQQRIAIGQCANGTYHGQLMVDADV
jgi:prepilin-type N-terminal cleavage/methylation domain-containing protein